MTTREDGDKLPLPLGWYMLLDASTRDEGELQGFVSRSDGQDSASLSYARETGELSGDLETKIPTVVMDEIRKEKYDDYE